VVNVKIRILRGVQIGGQPFAAGDTVVTDALTAGEVVATGRAEHTDDQGKAETHAAVQSLREQMFPNVRERVSNFWKGSRYNQ